MESSLLEHYEQVTGISLFNSPRTPITPALVPDGYEKIEVITGGRVIWPTESGDRIFGKGKIFWHSAGEYTVFRTFTETPYRCLVINLKVNSPRRPFPRLGFWRAATSLDQFVIDLLSMKESDKKLPPEPLLLYVLGVLCRQMLGRENAPLPAALRQACRIINQNPTAELDVSQLASTCDISRTQLFRLFRTHLGISPLQYSINQRITSARNLLSYQSFPIKQVAEICGFPTLEVFYRHFRRQTGFSPGEYRSHFGLKRE